MAIRRCPYCKAIIDEGSEYCSNCGTQLLFPEDEYIHEEIPGEKIVDEETPEEGNPKKGRSSSRRRKKKEEQQELEGVETEEEAESGKEEDVEKEVEFEPIEEGTEEKAAEDEIPVEMQEIAEGDDKEIAEEPQIEDESPDEEKPAGEDIPQAQEEERDEFFVEPQEPAFGTEDLEKVIDPEEKEKAEIEKFLRSLKDDRDEWNGEIPPTDELPPWAEKIKDEKPDEMHAAEAEVEAEPEEESQEFEELQEEAPVEEERAAEEEPPAEELPVEESPPIVDEEGTEEKEEVLRPMGLTPEDEVPEVQIPEEETEEEAAEKEKGEEELAEEEVSEEEEATMPDTGMGLPEGVEQENLPFADKSSEEFEDEEKSPPSKLSIWLKSRAFDVLFIAALWIVTLHIASRMLSTNLFKLISVSVLPIVSFYLVLLAVYLFLFFLFLGQTLGDHLFPYEE